MRARSNPSPLTVLVSLAYQDSDLILEQMGRSRKTESLDQAVKRLADFTGDDPYKIRNMALLRLSEYVASSFDDAGEALRWLIDVDHKLGVWAACQAARETLRFVPKGEQRPRKAIEVTEAWVRGKASIAKVQKASADAYDYDDSSAYAAYAAYSAPADAAAYIADAVAYDSSSVLFSKQWDAVRDAEFRRLVGVVADAIMSFPVTA